VRSTLERDVRKRTRAVRFLATHATARVA